MVEHSFCYEVVCVNFFILPAPRDVFQSDRQGPDQLSKQRYRDTEHHGDCVVIRPENTFRKNRRRWNKNRQAKNWENEIPVFEKEVSDFYHLLDMRFC